MVYEFGEFTLDTKRQQLRRGDEPRHLEPQVYAVLCYLLEHRDRLVTSKELIEHVWGKRFVTPGTLNSRIKALRQALGDDGATQRVIQTVHGRGFRVRIQVRTVVDSQDVSTPAVAGNGGMDEEARQQILFCRAHDGVRIAYAKSGDLGAPPLVKPANWLTHLEFDWNSPVWRHWLTEMGRGHTLIRYDARGCGLSDHDAPDISLESWVRDLEAVVAAERLQRFSLLGISQGCAVAIAYAARQPERVDKLVLYGGYAVGRSLRNMSPQEELERTLLQNLIRVGWGRDNPAFRQVFGTLFLPEGTAEQHQWFNDLAKTMPMENALRIRRVTDVIDVRREAAEVRAPTLVLHARGDGMIPFEYGRQLAALIPGARFVPLDSRNHVLLETEPAWARFVEDVRAFLGSDIARPQVRPAGHATTSELSDG
jgi:pimeloyl-ACP methyl ester carboxylesterase/DNA-binding winged helix-turn-helix (wHTH) protein